MKYTTCLFVALFFVLCALPLAELRLQFAPRARLFGSVAKPPPIPWTWEALWSGQLQQTIENRFSAAMGFKAHLVKSDNELNYRLFNQMNPNTNSELVLGKNNTLYQRPYINAMIRRDTVPPVFLEDKVLRLKKVQEYWKAHGKAFLVVLSPNKAALYPEDLPDEFRQQIDPQQPTNYDTFLAMAKQHGIELIDGQKLLLSTKDADRVRSIAKSAAHWNNQSACKVTDLIAESISRQLNKKLVRIACSEMTLRDIPRPIDRDLSDLGNLWDPAAMYEPVGYVRSKALRSGEEFKPSAMFIGGSFVWPLLNFAEKHRIFRRHTFFYYYKKKVTYPGRKEYKVDPVAMDWEKEIFSKDAIVIEANTAVVQTIGFGFLEDLEREIDRRKPPA